MSGARQEGSPAPGGSSSTRPSTGTSRPPQYGSLPPPSPAPGSTTRALVTVATGGAPPTFVARGPLVGVTFTLAATLASAAMKLLNRGPDGRMPGGWVAVTLVPVDSPDWPDTGLGRVVTRSIWSVLRRRR